MKNLSLNLLSLFLVSISALALEAGESQITKIFGADYVCKDAKNSVISINIKDKKVWQSEGDSTEGLELLVKDITVYRCPNCYDISAQLSILGTTANVDLKLRGLSNFKKATLSYAASSTESPLVEKKEFACDRL